MKNKYKIIGFTTTILALITCFTYLGMGTKTSAAPTKHESTKIINKGLTSNKVTKTSNVIIYTSQPYENFTNCKKVTDIGNLLNIKLNEKGINSNFISDTITKEYPQSDKEYINYYDITRKFITQNVKDYNNSIILNICRNELPKENIVIALSKTNPHYAENKKFADSLVEQFDKLGQTVRINYYTANKNYLNQDLSNQSILIGIGNNQSTNSELNQIVDTLVTALQNLQ